MKKTMAITQWVLGILSALSLILGLIYKVIYMITHALFIGYLSPMAVIWFSAACSLLSIALSLIKLGKLMEETGNKN